MRRQTVMERALEMVAEGIPDGEILAFIAKDARMPIEAAAQALAFWRGEDASDVIEDDDPRWRFVSRPGELVIVSETTGQRLIRLRSEQGLSQRDIAGPGISSAYISRIERGERTASAKALVKLADRLGVTALYLATGDAEGECPLCGRRP